jgi:hypothetical protein
VNQNQKTATAFAVLAFIFFCLTLYCLPVLRESQATSYQKESVLFFGSGTVVWIIVAVYWFKKKDKDPLGIRDEND